MPISGSALADNPAPGKEAAARAKSQIGVQFRLHGRMPGIALDCIGLAAFALWGAQSLQNVPSGYRLRGAHMAQILSELKGRGLSVCGEDAAFMDGDLLIFEPSARQLHLGIYIDAPLGGAFIHAHAGLRKIVITPGAADWKLAGRWRLSGA